MSKRCQKIYFLLETPKTENLTFDLLSMMRHCGNNVEFVEEGILDMENDYDTELVTKPPQNNTCLLYTSPSPRDKRQSRMPSSA